MLPGRGRRYISAMLLWAHDGAISKSEPFAVYVTIAIAVVITKCESYSRAV